MFPNPPDRSAILFILGTGSSVDTLSPDQFSLIAKETSIGINGWAAHSFRPDYYMFEKGHDVQHPDQHPINFLLSGSDLRGSKVLWHIAPNKSQSNLLREFQDAGGQLQFYNSWHLSQAYPGSLQMALAFCRKAFGRVISRPPGKASRDPRLHNHVPKVAHWSFRLFWSFLTEVRESERLAVFDKRVSLPWRIFHRLPRVFRPALTARSSVSRAVSLAASSGWQTIVLVGVDLGGRYFEQYERIVKHTERAPGNVPSDAYGIGLDSRHRVDGANRGMLALGALLSRVRVALERSGSAELFDGTPGGNPLLGLKPFKWNHNSALRDR